MSSRTTRRAATTRCPARTSAPAWTRGPCTRWPAAWTVPTACSPTGPASSPTRAIRTATTGSTWSTAPADPCTSRLTRRSHVNRWSVVLRFGLLTAVTAALLAPSMAAPRPFASPRLSYALASSPDPTVAGQWSSLMNGPLVAVHSIVLRTGKILMWDAWETGGTPSARLWDPATQTFTGVPVPLSQIFCSGHVELADGRVLVVGGHNGPENGIQDVNIFDPSTDKWSP